VVVTVSLSPARSRCRHLLSFPHSEENQTDPAKYEFWVNALSKDFLALSRNGTAFRKYREAQNFSASRD
jgi:hypothetical protein